MKYIPAIAGALLGLLFAVFSLMVLLKLVPVPPPPADSSPVALFMGAFGQTGYLTFVKVFELIGGILVAIPRTRNFGLLVLGPIILNILAFHVFITKGAGLFETTARPHSYACRLSALVGTESLRAADPLMTAAAALSVRSRIGRTRDESEESRLRGLVGGESWRPTGFPVSRRRWTANYTLKASRTTRIWRA